MNPSSSSPTQSSVRRGERVRYELKMRELQVVRTQILGSSLLAVTLGGEALADFQSLGFDDHVKIMIPAAGGEPLKRDYTPRHFDAARRELSIEFALHEHGAVTDWARQAKPGDRVVVGGPRGSMIVSRDYDWTLWIGDRSAFPAMRRALEEFPVDRVAGVLVLCDESEGRTLFCSVPEDRLYCVQSVAALLERLQALKIPEGEGYIWCAGESVLATGVRNILVEKGHPKQGMRVAAYWKAGASGFHEKLE